MFFNNIPMCSDKIKYAYARRVQYFSMIETFSPPFCTIGENHHFKVVMVPFNLHLQDAANNPTQSVKGKRFPLLQAAAQLGINVISSSPLFQVK